jgi:hypothetical protein
VNGHALVVGGSGMLAGLCRSLAADGRHVTIVGRDGGRLRRAAGGSRRISTLSVNYELVPEFVAALADAVRDHGAIDLAVCWIRSWVPEALLATAAAVAPGGRIFHVLGSARSDASAPAIAELQGRDDLLYRQVQLGSIGGRWLTDEEISAGVLAAIRADELHYLVGESTP